MKYNNISIASDPALKNYFQNSEAIADLINALWFEGKCIINSDDIIEANPELSGIIKINKLIQSYLSFRDILFRVKIKNQFHYFGIENSQSNDYTLGIRICRYNFFSNNKEYDEFTRAVRKAKKEKKTIPVLHLTPVHTIGLYWGGGKVNKYRKISDYMDEHLYLMPDNDVKARIISIDDIDTEMFHNEYNKQIFKTVQQLNAVDGDVNLLKEIRLSKEVILIVATVTNCPELLKFSEESKEQEEILMNKSLEKMINKGMKQGIEQGKISAIKRIAKSMKDEGIDIDLIKKCTSLSKEAILSL